MLCRVNNGITNEILSPMDKLDLKSSESDKSIHALNYSKSKRIWKRELDKFSLVGTWLMS